MTRTTRRAVKCAKILRGKSRGKTWKKTRKTLSTHVIFKISNNFWRDVSSPLRLIYAKTSDFETFDSIRPFQYKITQRSPLPSWDFDDLHIVPNWTDWLKNRKFISMRKIFFSLKIIQLTDFCLMMIFLFSSYQTDWPENESEIGKLA